MLKTQHLSFTTPLTIECLPGHQLSILPVSRHYRLVLRATFTEISVSLPLLDTKLQTNMFFRRLHVLAHCSHNELDVYYCTQQLTRVVSGTNTRVKYALTSCLKLIITI